MGCPFLSPFYRWASQAQATLRDYSKVTQRLIFEFAAPTQVSLLLLLLLFSTNAFPPLSPAVGFSQLSHGSISPLGGPAFPSLPTLCPEPRSLQLYSRIWHEPDLAHQTLAFKLVSCMI